jgi:5'-deoxynucleotidase YfbR-like HD superfamily hydrolase
MSSRPERDGAAVRAASDLADRPRAWQRMLSGRRLDLLDPDPADIAIEDIAHGLARVARWNGQTIGAHAFSVAEHALLVEEIASASRPDWPNAWRLAALLHDAPEYVIGDLISPFKAAVGLDYKIFERRLQAAIHRRFGLPETLPEAVAEAVKQADTIAAYHEATQLAGFSLAEGGRYFGQPPPMPEVLARRLARLTPSPTDLVQARFLARHAELAGG